MTKINKLDRTAYALLAAIFLARLIFISAMGLVADEAYYWDWSRSLALGYFDHPPMAAWMIYAGSHLFGPTNLGVKFMAVAGCLGASLFTYWLAKRFVAKQSSVVVLILLSSFVMVFGIGGLIATPDIPMVLFWAGGLYAAYAFIFDNRPWAWLFLGVCVGLGLLSKYIFGLFVVSLIIFLLVSKPHRRLLFSGRLIGAGAVAALLFLPNILWNSQHQWISFAYQMRHGLGAEKFPAFDCLGEFLGGQIGMLSIFPFILLVIALIKELRYHRGDSKRMFVIAFCLVPLVFFSFSSLQKKVEPNWPCEAYVSGLTLITLLWEETGENRKKFRRFMLGSVIIACAATIIVMVHILKPILPLAAANDPTSQIRGWKQWALSIDSVRAKADPAHALPVCTQFYQDAAFLAFYLPDHPATHALNVNSRPSQYSLLESQAGIYGKRVLIVIPGADSLLAPEFSRRVEGAEKKALIRPPQGSGRDKPYSVFTGVLKPAP